MLSDAVILFQKKKKKKKKTYFEHFELGFNVTKTVCKHLLLLLFVLVRIKTAADET